jgi:ribonucleoside-diphosphate reductase beta chain
MPSLLSHPPMVYKFDHGYDFPVFNEYFKGAVLSVWNPWEVSLRSDCQDWEQNTSQSERDLIAGVLRGFTSAELGISCYWSDTVCRIFPKPEIQDMAKMFSAFERIHAAAYNYLSDTLGLNEFEAFISDETAKKKVERFFTDCKSDKVSLAVFSGAGEGVSLYSSFAILLAFAKDGRFKGIEQIISWSVIDEAKHSDAGSDLFKELVRETGITEEELSEIYRGFDTVIGNEFSFLENIFGKIDNSAIPIKLEELKSYIKLRANNRLSNLDLDYQIPMTAEEKSLALNISSWFEPMVRGQISHDAFARAKAGDSYVAKPSQNFDSVDLSTLDLVLT